MTDEPQKTTSIPFKLLPLTWGDPGLAAFVNHAVAQYDGKSVYVTFGQTSPPVILGPTAEEKQEQLDKLQTIPVTPIIRLVMTAEDFRRISQVFQQHLEMMDQLDKQEKP